MKVLLVSNMYPSRKYPHYGVFVENTQKVLAQMPDMRVDKVVLTKCDGKLQKLLGYLKFYCGTVFGGIFGRYDVIYGHFVSHIAMPLLVVKALNRRVKLVLNAHGNDVVADHEKDDKWVRLSRKILPKADHVIVPSDYFKTVLCENFAVAEDKILVYPSGGIDREVFCRKAVQDTYGLDPDKKYIGYISRIEKNKGWDTFLEMAAALGNRADVGFVVVGDGAERAEFDEMANRLGIADRLVRFPLLHQSQIAELYNLLEVFCFPTRRASESLGLVGLEAMACGCIVVACALYGPSSYMQDGVNGFVFRQNSAEELTAQVTRALSLSAQEKEVLQQGMASTAEAYSKQAVDRILTEFFTELKP